MNLSRIHSQLITDEGVVLKPYRDTNHILSIGVGRNLESNGITHEEALYLLGNDVNNAINDLDNAVPYWRSASEPRQEVLVNMCFNMGITRLLRFVRMWDAIRDKDWVRAAKEMRDSKWYREDVGIARSGRLITQMVAGELQ